MLTYALDIFMTEFQTDRASKPNRLVDYSALKSHVALLTDQVYFHIDSMCLDRRTSKIILL